MSDEEDNWMQDEDNEKKPAKKEEPAEQKTEAQLLIEAKLRKHEDEDEARIREIEEQRRVQKQKEDDELRRLKEKQAQRKKEREEEDRRLEEQKKMLEEQKRKEDEERKQKLEDEKRRKVEEAERKKAAAQAAMAGGRNFVLDKEKSGGESTIDKFMNISKAKTEMSLNTGELEALKAKTIGDRLKPLSISGLDNVGLKQLAESLWKQIIQIETSKYDLDERSKRQEYDLRELNERQRQINQKKYLAAGLEAENQRYPPKVKIISKHERLTDRRTFSDKKGLFDGAKVEDKGEINKPVAKKRDDKGWIKAPKKEEQKRYSYDDEEDAADKQNNEEPAEEEDPWQAKKSSSFSHREEEPVEAEEEEE
ncbi:putative Troponin T, skeletal muscle [Hypsibius exemplaris]|uniref:Troponin T, skeletal muscle n=1 Tax=Hypsibius exemplaris TaxID=2072580 RepID=A0A1W0WFA3_HYPEX|nr:putative Troponin T, skeletal muscle [Hypsibius exemplaris]